MDLMGENHLRDTTEGAITSVVGGSSTNGGVKKGDMSESTSTFTHQPLDHTKESIRILTINPDLSNDSLVQCTMRNSTADDQYICLSYVWGPEDVSHSILIDGRLFAIRKNLLDFLLVARTKYKNKGLWIDALCIDQNNTTERNHQVQQMGQIFSRAQRVIAWLGIDKRLARYLKYMRRSIPSRLANPPYYTDAVGDHPVYKKGLRIINVVGNWPNWFRAWITQEVALAKDLVFLARRTTLSRAKMQAFLPAVFQPWTHQSNIAINTTLQSGQWKGENLLFLLDKFLFKKCKVPRDTIFSLLAISKEGKRFTVDYSMSEAEVAMHTLRNCDTPYCFCDIWLVGSRLGLHRLHFQTPSLKRISETLGSVFQPSQIHYRVEETQNNSNSECSSERRAWCVGRSTCLSVLPKYWPHQSGQLYCLDDPARDIRAHFFQRRDSSPIISPYSSVPVHSSSFLYVEMWDHVKVQGRECHYRDIMPRASRPVTALMDLVGEAIQDTVKENDGFNSLFVELAISSI